MFGTDSDVAVGVGVLVGVCVGVVVGVGVGVLVDVDVLVTVGVAVRVGVRRRSSSEESGEAGRDTSTRVAANSTSRTVAAICQRYFLMVVMSAIIPEVLQYHCSLPVYIDTVTIQEYYKHKKANRRTDMEIKEVVEINGLEVKFSGIKFGERSTWKNRFTATEAGVEVHKMLSSGEADKVLSVTTCKVYRYPEEVKE